MFSPAILRALVVAAQLLCSASHAQQIAPVQDLEKLAKQLTSGSVAGEQQAGVMLFVSLGMPPAVLKELARQAAAADITLVMRGFPKARNEDPPIDMAGAAQKISELLAPTGLEREVVTGSWSIDPQAFKSFGIAKVPALVVARQRLPGPQCQQSAATAVAKDALSQVCAADWDAAIVYGDVSLNEALRRASRTKDPELARMAVRTLARLEGRDVVPRATSTGASSAIPQTQPGSSQGGIRIR